MGRKVFLTQDEISKLLKNYGGGYRWKLNKDLSQKSDQKVYMDASDGMLTINRKWDKETDTSYVMVHISDASGKIYRKDRWNFFPDVRQLYFDYSIDKDGNYDMELKRLDGGNMAKRQSKTQRLQSELNNYKKWLQESEARNQKMREQAENSFLNSATYCQMMEKIGFIEALNNLNQSHIKHLESQKRKVDESIQQIYTDNKAMMEHYKEDGEENPYFIGLTENWHEAKEYTKLKSEIADLKGKVEGLETLLKDRNAEISNLQWIIAKDDEKFHLEVARKRAYELELEIEELKSTPTTTPPDVKFYLDDEQMERVNQTQAELEKSNSENQELRKRVNELSEETHEQRQTIRKLESEVSRQKTLRMNVKSDLDEVERELESERMKKYDQYVPEDAASYQAMAHDLKFYKNMCEQQTDYRQTLERRIRELEEQVSDLATTNLPTDEAVAIIEQNIEQAKQLKSETRRKQGRPPKMDERTIALIHELKNNGHSIRDIASQVGYSVGSIHRVLKKDE